MAPRTRWPLLALLAALSLPAVAFPGCTSSGSASADVRAASVPSPLAARSLASIQGAWRLVETAVRVPDGTWDQRPAPQGGVYVFSARHYSYFYVRGSEPRARFADANHPTEAEKAAAYDSFIAGAGSYTFDGQTLELVAEFRKNPNEMTGEIWRLKAEAKGDTLQLLFVNPPFLPGREWRTTIARIE